MKKNLLILIMTPFLIFSCVPEEEGLSADFDVPLKWSDKSASMEWDLSLKKALETYGEELMDSVPSDINKFSTNYRSMDYNGRLNFWAYLISIMAQRESNFNPDAFYVENFNDANGNRVVSRGLLQLSIESARGYRCPFLNSAQDLHDPENNLICSVLIMKRWVVQDGLISGRASSGRWRGGARYWSVLRKSTTLNFFKSFTLKLF